ncbi:MAG TPA: NAD(P)/FAD-dependent oxidoreductase [Pseudonocardiaceae bacterium]|jgi:FAD-dependent urate hydroxylase|nr:NAD(P)/FAD-dependent oxidoreductase [Pseudonocardiaceae bacterium]
MTMKNHILIVGAGLTGLALAAGLRHRGVDAVVVEQAPVITEAGWGIGLTKRHVAALDRLGVTDRDNWIRFRPDRHMMFDGDTGLLDSMSLDTAMLFSRSDLQHSLYEPVADLVRTGVRPRALTDLGDAVEVEFDNGERESFDVVIGADGINSWTRRQVLGGPDATYTGMAIIRFHAANPDPTLTTTALALSATGVLGYFLMDGGRVFHGIVMLPGEENNRHELTVAELADLFPSVTGPLVGFANVMRTNPDSYYANIYQAVVPEWTRNRVGLMGDAAHAMSPILAQGTGVGLEDAALLADLLATQDLPVPIALASYEKIRKPKGQAVQLASYEATLQVGRQTAPTELFPEFVTQTNSL